MNFKALALGSVLALGSIFGSVGAAEARPSDCWSNSGRGTTLQHFPCDVDRYTTNGNFDWVGPYFHIEGFGRVFLQDDGQAKIVFDNGRTLWYTWHYDSDGDIRVNGNNGYQFSFRI